MCLPNAAAMLKFATVMFFISLVPYPAEGYRKNDDSAYLYATKDGVYWVRIEKESGCVYFLFAYDGNPKWRLSTAHFKNKCLNLPESNKFIYIINYEKEAGVIHSFPEYPYNTVFRLNSKTKEVCFLLDGGKYGWVSNFVTHGRMEIKVEGELYSKCE